MKFDLKEIHLFFILIPLDVGEGQNEGIDFITAIKMKETFAIDSDFLEELHYWFE